MTRRREGLLKFLKMNFFDMKGSGSLSFSSSQSLRLSKFPCYENGFIIFFGLQSTSLVIGFLLQYSPFQLVALVTCNQHK